MEDNVQGKKMKPLFRLERYFFTRTSCVATPNFQKGKVKDGNVEARAGLMNNQQDPSRWRINLEIGWSKDMDRSGVPYDFALKVVGFFICPDTKEGSEEHNRKIAPHIYVQGSSLLYSLAMEYLRNITAAGPYGPFILPTYSFVPSDLKAGRNNPKMFYVGKSPFDKGLIN